MDIQIENELRLPPRLLSDEEYNALAIRQKSAYVRRVIEKIFILNKDRIHGITAADLAEILPFSKNTIHTHLKQLLAIRDIYAVRTGQRMLNYFPNGKLDHSFHNSRIQIDNNIYSISLLQRGRGIQVLIQETSIDRYGGEKKLGGLIVNAEHFQTFIEGLLQLSPEIQKENRKFIERTKEVIQ